MDIFNQIWEWLSNLLVEALTAISNLLPDSPFKMLDNTPIKPYIAAINWVIPLDFIVDTLLLWLAAVAIYYTWSVLLRWVKAID